MAEAHLARILQGSTLAKTWSHSICGRADLRSSTPSHSRTRTETTSAGCLPCSRTSIPANCGVLLVPQPRHMLRLLRRRAPLIFPSWSVWLEIDLNLAARELTSLLQDPARCLKPSEGMTTPWCWKSPTEAHQHCLKVTRRRRPSA